MFATTVFLVSACLPQQPAAAARHWAYVAPVRPAAPREHGSPIDAFIDAELARRGLEPLPMASPEVLLRRLALDLTGLPPTPAEIDAFLADPRPDAWERQVDRLLASPHFGERQATAWLDLARYGDSNGFNFDTPRSLWVWRDALVAALDADQPFDRFTLEQLAGDLLPDADERTRIATGFHRNTMLNEEGGVDADEARWQRDLDRASTTATVWLGTTLHCAQCHDHKYDPFPQTDFYGLVAFFVAQDEVVLELPDRGKVAGKPVTTLVLRERPGAEPVTTLRIRGSYDQRGASVTAHTPAALPPWPVDAPRNRLGLARWLVAADNPLTARVYVNRVWGALFGRPLVATPEDFGTQAPAPEHPELLDWLATEFVRLGWRPKALLRAIVTSAAYRRASRVTREHLVADPDNRWLARGARFRLDAEAIRDTWLLASGLLDPTIGGPPVFPLQADTSGVVPLNKVDLRWQPSAGGDRWRRGLYTMWRRTAPFVQFALFDAPTREQCTARRPRTNTPLQALSGLNDPTAWAAAQALGERMAAAPGDDRARLALGFRLCTARVPDGRELDLLAAALAAESPARRWTMVANVLLNLDETLTRG